MAVDGFFEYGELTGEARKRAFETWSDHMGRHAREINGPDIERNMESMGHVLGSVGCKISSWSAPCDGGHGQVGIALDGRVAELGPAGAGEALPLAKSDGSLLGDSYADMWNNDGNYRPFLADAFARGLAGAEADYLERAQDMADSWMSDMLALARYMLSRDRFDDDVAVGVPRFDEDGTYVPGA